MRKEQILEQALQLDLKDRAELAQQLLSSLEQISPEEHDRLWTEVAARRAEELQSGKTKGYSWEEIKQDALSRLG
ncbi:MAG: addiction module protein [Meiothermus ruber]|jgi:putative addiction module component (TIGR02574 family)|nr:addiction module protein [Meiothermus ruber]